MAIELRCGHILGNAFEDLRARPPAGGGREEQFLLARLVEGFAHRVPQNHSSEPPGERDASRHDHELRVRHIDVLVRHEH
eukprot:CAMPEP_0174989346 /NCGR_PEP_ID=MMETSP0004_2-20121128/20670_1 /TAXON_ID=420556 /ORGANISM="Ochromonas sp., Strain CCMP1393" /LENGTH=79 /DNA_ID=CAMNT_0016242743 /DNA_START=620 /DNA_END=859 /DNA_ORIENTATION=+